jgi:tetratricopeptide (TPR) repeat protein
MQKALKPITLTPPRHTPGKKITLGITIVGLISVLCILISCVALVTHFPQSKDIISFGNTEYSKGNIFGGKVSYALAFALDVDLRKAVDQCHTYFELWDLDKLFDQCSQTIERYGYVVSPYFDRGSAYAKIDQYSKAIKDFTTAIQLNPMDSRFYIGRGNVFQAQQQYALANADFTKAISINPNEPSYYVARAYSYLGQININFAFSDCRTALRLDSNYADGYFCLGRTYQTQGKDGLAIPEYNKAIGLTPRFSDAYFYRGLIYTSQGAYYAALTDFNKAIENNNNDEDAYTWRGNIYANLGYYDAAIWDYEMAIAIIQDPKASSYVYCVKGITYTKMGDFNSAITALEIGVENDLNNEYGWCKSALDNARLGISTP